MRAVGVAEILTGKARIGGVLPPGLTVASATAMLRHGTTVPDHGTKSFDNGQPPLGYLRLSARARELELSVDTTLEDQVAIVTGGSGGIGQAYCRALAKDGASVVVADIDGEGAAAFAAELESEGLTALGVAVDVTDPVSAEAMVEAAISRFGGVDILVNNAGIMSKIPRTSLLLVEPDSWDLAMRVNAMSVIVCSRAVVPSMKERGGGKIINQASTAAFEPGGLYRISKLAVVGLTAGLAKELGPENINVNGIAPGMIQTEESFRSAGGPESERRIARAASGVPNPRPDRDPGALVGALMLLASEAGDYINGQTLILDGGRNMRL